MKFLLITIFAFTASVTAKENYDGPEWRQIDLSNILPIEETPGFWDDKTEVPEIFRQTGHRSRRIVNGAEAVPGQ